MTSQCGSDSPDGGAVMSEIETAIFTIITSAGEARASLYQKAHDMQTELITRDLNGSLPMSLLLVHAQDQLMTTMSEQSLIEHMIGLIRDIGMNGGK